MDVGLYLCVVPPSRPVVSQTCSPGSRSESVREHKPARAGLAGCHASVIDAFRARPRPFKYLTRIALPNSPLDLNLPFPPIFLAFFSPPPLIPCHRRYVCRGSCPDRVQCASHALSAGVRSNLHKFAADQPESRSPSPAGNEVLTLRSLVSTKDAGVIIGKGGKNVAELREATAVKAGVSKVIPGVHERVLTVTGSVEGVAKVRCESCIYARFPPC